MDGVKSAIRVAILVFAGMTMLASLTRAQDGSIEFVARATPTGGLQEPIRGFPFYLLRKSFASIKKEADTSDPKPNMDAFIDELSVSSQLKAWMKKNHDLSLAGENFVHKLHADDILNVPEFRKAYLDRNSGDQSVNFPKPRFKPEDARKHPARFKKRLAEYNEAIHRFIERNPQSIDGIDLELSNIDAGPKWKALLDRRRREVRRRALDLAESKYLVARTQTNLRGQGFISGVPPGTYWLSTLNLAADIGDVRPRWDVEVTVAPRQTRRITLSDVNAVLASDQAP